MVFFPGTPKDSSATPYSWWNKGKPYATNVGGQPMTRLMTATENTPGMLHVRSQNYPIGQWNGRKGFVLNSEYVNPEGVNVSENLYTWKPGYGYKKITQEPSTSLAFFERKPYTMSQITTENATSITPEQWTAAQDVAIAKGDMVEAQRLRDLHSSLTDSATPGKYYRGTQTKRNSYPDRHIDEEVGEMNGIYLTKKPKYAKTYGDVEEFYLRSNNPLKTEGSWTGVIDDATRAEIENAGYDAVVNNRFDTGFLNKLLRNSRDETITFNGKNLKLADAVTYDDKGVRIPLGKRDNFNINDIRYGLLPFGIGLTGYGLYKRKQGGKMNTLQFLKNGSGIHIKKKNRGKFTSYCGGKVTDSCIRRAKASGNPTLVKRATFAANVRKWKHQDGGTLDTNAKRINSTHSQIRMPNGTMKSIPSEIPLAPDGDSWILGLSGGAKGAGIMQELWNYFKWKQVNKPKMVGPFNLTKPVSYSKVSNYPKPLYIKIADMIAPF